ncbi:MAG: metallophosphoesterase [Mobilitalea sp.]
MSKIVFKWVQISDVHFRAKDKDKDKEYFNSGLLKEELLNELKKVKNVDALLVTGDFRFAPDKENNPKAVADYLRKIASNLGIDISKVLMVPGNHDLRRGTARTDIAKAEWDKYSPTCGTFDVERLDILQFGFDFFNKLSDELGYKCFENTTTPHALVDMGACNILLLNTAITACGNEDAHHLIVGSNYIRGLLHNVDKPVIAMGHHGFELFNEEENRTCTTFLEKSGVYLYLCGHSHIMWGSSYGEKSKQINVGCLIQEDKSTIAGFSVGSLYNDGTVKTCSFVWDMGNQKWEPKTTNDKEYPQLYGNIMKTEDEIPAVAGVLKKVENPFTLVGYTLLGGRGIDGIKYHWEKGGKEVESLAFNKRLKESSDLEEGKTSAYTVSVSYGCQLSSTDMQCSFCETGKQVYKGNLHADEIALQNIFMAEYDANCPSFPQVRNNKREFAYMGQGEPGLNYPAVKQSILLTDCAMSKIDQTVSRYIISTCGIYDFIPSLIDDISHGCFKNKVTLHLSLHAIDNERDILMPINKDYNYKEFIKYCARLREVSNEKIGVGILMFNKFCIGKKTDPYTLTPEKLELILNQLDKDIFRIDLCDVNKMSTGSQSPLRNEDAKKLCEVINNMGFEGKTFSSFGDSEQSGCGMLNSTTDSMSEIGVKSIEHFNAAVDLLNRAKEEIGL